MCWLSKTFFIFLFCSPNSKAHSQSLCQASTDVPSLIQKCWHSMCFPFQSFSDSEKICSMLVMEHSPERSGDCLSLSTLTRLCELQGQSHQGRKEHQSPLPLVQVRRCSCLQEENTGCSELSGFQFCRCWTAKVFKGAMAKPQSSGSQCEAPSLAAVPPGAVWKWGS